MDWTLAEVVGAVVGAVTLPLLAGWGAWVMGELRELRQRANALESAAAVAAERIAQLEEDVVKAETSAAALRAHVHGLERALR